MENKEPGLPCEGEMEFPGQKCGLDPTDRSEYFELSGLELQSGAESVVLKYTPFEDHQALCLSHLDSFR